MCSQRFALPSKPNFFPRCCCKWKPGQIPHWFPGCDREPRWVGCPRDSDCSIYHLPLYMVPSTLYPVPSSPPLSRVTRLRRVQRWLAPSPINRSHTFVSKHSPTLCIQPHRVSGALDSCVISCKPSFRTSLDLHKVTVIPNLDIPRM